jgi:hypothetical protein
VQRRLLTAAVSAVSGVCLGATAAHAQASSTVAITGVAVVDVVAGTTRPGQTVLIAGNRIAAVGPATSVRVPAGARTVNGAGRFLVPGLWDMHSHAVTFGPMSLPLYLAHGVTSLRDMGAERFADAKAWRDSIAAGRLLGPRMRIAAPVVENARWLAAVKRMGEAAGTPWTLYERFGPTSPEEGVRWVDSVAALGPDHIKVRNWPAPEIGRALLPRARARGLPVVAHANEPFPRAGVATFEHGVWPPLGDAPVHLHEREDRRPIEDTTTGAHDAAASRGAPDAPRSDERPAGSLTVLRHRRAAAAAVTALRRTGPRSPDSRSGVFLLSCW